MVYFQENVAFLCASFAITSAEFTVMVDSQRSPVLPMQQFADVVLWVWHRQQSWMGNVWRWFVPYSHWIQT